MIFLIRSFCLFVFLSIAILPTYGSQHFESTSILQIREAILKKSERHSPSNVLIVFDIDNTLLKPSQSLGSDQWFSWQEKGLGQSFDGKVGDTFPVLLEAYGLILQMSKMRSVEKDTARVIRDLQNRKYRLIALTSRGPESHSATLEQLKSQKINFKRTKVSAKDEVRGTSYPYRLKGVDEKSDSEKIYQAVSNKFRIPIEKVREMKLGYPRKGLYQDGVFSSSGQHKGMMLRLFLERSDFEPEVIIFIDDREKHVKGIHLVFEDVLPPQKKLELVTFRYGHEDKTVEEFDGHDSSEKKKAARDWNQLRPILNRVFGYSF